jgi:hypothetical protein
MSLWGNIDNAANSVKWATTYVNLPFNTNNQANLYQSNKVSKFLNNNLAVGRAIGQFGVSAAEADRALTDGIKITHAGWNLRTEGTGPLLSITITAPGRLYTNANILTVRAGTGGVNGIANLVTNALGNVVGYSVNTVSNPDATLGSGYVSATPTVTITTSTGANATITSAAGGRAGRVQYEALVAMGSQDSGSADDLYLPQA